MTKKQKLELKQKMHQHQLQKTKSHMLEPRHKLQIQKEETKKLLRAAFGYYVVGG